MKNQNLEPYEREFLKILARQLQRNLEKKKQMNESDKKVDSPKPLDPV
ncbi:hypothetical protein ACIOBL_01205 [Paenibacillus taichungensis]|uniref:Uncharacterized protein n=1 Tax=Paenibacillus pabuli TaxID=1472 RepID=A0A855Y3L7_9BACL|nr:hypothetical protein DET56_109225 [Paenibacillus pabuli]PXW05481.1 hypothetical protein DEU73_108224 [Paenibacillus taichungensis]